MRHYKHCSILDLLRQGQELLAQCMRRLKLGTQVIITVQATQHGEKLVRIFQILTELSTDQRCQSSGHSHIETPPGATFLEDAVHVDGLSYTSEGLFS